MEEIVGIHEWAHGISHYGVSEAESRLDASGKRHDNRTRKERLNQLDEAFSHASLTTRHKEAIAQGITWLVLNRSYSGKYGENIRAVFLRLMKLQDFEYQLGDEQLRGALELDWEAVIQEIQNGSTKLLDGWLNQQSI